jgi:hypothetical protein
MNVAYAAFLKPATSAGGLQTLAWVILLSSVLSVPMLAIYSFADRADNNRLYAYMLIGLGAIILVSLALLGPSRHCRCSLFPCCMCLARLALPSLTIISLPLLMIYDIQSAKRVLPLIPGGGRIGAARQVSAQSFNRSSVHADYMDSLP